MNCNIQNQLDSFIIKKTREHQKDERVSDQYKQARAYFFTHHIKNKMKEAGATEIEQNLAVRILVKTSLERNSLSSQIQLPPRKIIQNMMSQYNLAKYEKQIGSLYGDYQFIKRQFHRKQKECLPLLQIFDNQFDHLRVIQIQYELTLDKSTKKICRYSISAFELFKIIHNNKLLSQVTLKGVQINKFEQFLNKIHLFNREKIEQLKEQEYNWMQNFNQSKKLKLSIDTEIKFYLELEKRKILDKIDDLLYFCRLFYWVSNITVDITLGEWQNINDWGNVLEDLWKCLKSIKKIRLKISRGFLAKITNKQISIVRSLLFGGLASFVEITHLSLQGVNFSKSIRDNDFFAMQKQLGTVFNNNAITHLQLTWCNNFPIFPEINTLQSLFLNSVSFRKQFAFIRDLTQNNPLLTYIHCQQIHQEWRIDELILNRLQNLIIWRCSGIKLGEITSVSPSNIKDLRISFTEIGRIQCLSLIFPKLTNINSLSLCGTSFGRNLLFTIPSPHLQALQISFNQFITDEDFRMIDERWPNLKIISQSQCKKLTANVWSTCKFNGLMRLAVDQLMLSEWKQALLPHVANGIKLQLD